MLNPYFLVLLLVTSTRAVSNCSTDDIISRDGSACYRYYPIGLTYDDARAVCRLFHGDILQDLGELSLVIRTCKGCRRMAVYQLWSEFHWVQPCTGHSFEINETMEFGFGDTHPFACKSKPNFDAWRSSLPWKQPLGNAYRFHTERKTWKDARQHCREEGGDLATIANAEENIFINQHSRLAPSWIGAQKRDENMEWINGEPVHYNGSSQTFNTWHDNIDFSANNSCLSIFLQKWAPMKCDLKLSYICQKSI